MHLYNYENVIRSKKNFIERNITSRVKLRVRQLLQSCYEETSLVVVNINYTIKEATLRSSARVSQDFSRVSSESFWQC